MSTYSSRRKGRRHNMGTDGDILFDGDLPPVEVYRKPLWKRIYDYWNLLPCHKCGSRNPATAHTVDMLDNCLVTEEEYHCPDCGAVVGYWTHGYMAPPYDRASLWRMRLVQLRYIASRMLIEHWGFTEHYHGSGIGDPGNDWQCSWEPLPGGHGVSWSFGSK